MDYVTCIISSFLKHLSGNYNYYNPLFGRFKGFSELLGVFLLFGFGLKVLNFTWFGFPRMPAAKSGVFGGGICSETIGDGESSREQFDEDKVFDVMTLREMVKMERLRADSALLELDRERNSAAVSAEESMAMILRLQSEKSVAEMELKQYKRVAEEKLAYDQELIQSLQWMVTQYESERSSMEDEVALSQEKLRQYKEDVEESFRTPIGYGKLKSSSKRCLIRSLDLAIST